jgi:hypothetical protein
VTLTPGYVSDAVSIFGLSERADSEAFHDVFVHQLSVGRQITSSARAWHPAAAGLETTGLLVDDCPGLFTDRGHLNLAFQNLTRAGMVELATGPQMAAQSGSSILTGQPGVWISAARLNEGGP